MRNLSRRVVLMAIGLGLGGCSLFDPYQREGTWRPTGASNANIAAQIVRPSDLVRGVEYAPLDASMTAAAVGRYRAGKIRKLPDSSLSTIKLSGTGAHDAGEADAPTTGTMVGP